jgi:hypothetical protein
VISGRFFDGFVHAIAAAMLICFLVGAIVGVAATKCAQTYRVHVNVEKKS